MDGFCNDPSYTEGFHRFIILISGFYYNSLRSFRNFNSNILRYVFLSLHFLSIFGDFVYFMFFQSAPAAFFILHPGTKKAARISPEQQF